MNMQTHLQTYRLWLEPDPKIPRFLRLRWEKTGVSIQDVLLNGVHPWMGGDEHYTLADAFLARMNEPQAKVAELDEFNYCGNVSVSYGFSWNRQPRFEVVLKQLHEEIYFVEDLTFGQLLEIAKQRLREDWKHSTAKNLAREACPGFQELRAFLKEKDKAVKLSSYEDIDQYDLGQVLTVEDFARRDRLLVHHGIPMLNFRKASALHSVTDETGRLRLVPEIRDITLTSPMTGPSHAYLVWHAVRKGNHLRFRPDMGKGGLAMAKEFAGQWRTDDGQLCFQTTVERLAEMLETKAVMATFPSLDYNTPHDGPTASAEVRFSRIKTYHIGRFAGRNVTGDILKEALRHYSVPMTGNKDQLLQKLARLAGKKYREALPVMDRFFGDFRVVHVQCEPRDSAEFPVLENLSFLRNLLLTMYAVKHLRGGAILEPSHDNPAYGEEELALALLTGKVGFQGAFLRVA